MTHTTRDGEGGVGKAEKPHIFTHAWQAGGQWQQVHLQDGAASSRALSGFVGVHPELQWGKTTDIVVKQTGPEGCLHTVEIQTEI